jgi:prepilin-type N-terminal cleavage/methylation domain-containing protein/prepilin-type processing-associated H-X9-DG protein
MKLATPHRTQSLSSTHARVAHTRSAFTLVELLIVIAIICLLAAILFPVFALARENARRSACLSNMKQIGLSMQMYLSDYDETYVPTILADTNVSATNPYGWADALYPYTKSVQLFQCPSDKRPPCAPGNGSPVDPKEQHLKPSDTTVTCGYTDYIMNAGFSGVAANGSGTVTGVRASRVASSAQTLLFTDARGNLTRLVANGCRTTGGASRTDPIFLSTGHFGCASTAQGVLDNRTDNYHLEGTNVAFADGHVKWFRYPSSKIYNRYTPAAEADGGATYSLS